MGNKQAARPAADSSAKLPKIVAIDADGKATRLKAERLEIDFGDGRKLLLAFPERAWGDLEIEADADDEAAVPMLSLQPGACNLLTLRVDVHHDMAFLEPLDLPQAAHSPVLKLSVQKAVEGDDKANAPKKNHIRRWAQAALQQDAQVTVRLVGEDEGRSLNHDYRGKDYATNVLTFAYAEGEDLPGVPFRPRTARLPATSCCACRWWCARRRPRARPLRRTSPTSSCMACCTCKVSITRTRSRPPKWKRWKPRSCVPSATPTPMPERPRGAAPAGAGA